MYQEITSALAASNAAVRMVAEVLKTVQDVKVKQAITDLQDRILDLQSKLFAFQDDYAQLAESKRAVEAKLAQHESWDAKVSKYILTELAPGILVHGLRPELRGSEPEHFLCTNCYSDEKLSILTRPSVGSSRYECPKCEHVVRPEPMTSPMVFSAGSGSHLDTSML